MCPTSRTSRFDGQERPCITIPGNNTVRLRTFPVQQLDHRRKSAPNIPLILLYLDDAAIDAAIDAARDFGLDLTEHRATDMTDFDIRNDDLLLVMEDLHIGCPPAWLEKTFRSVCWGYGAAPDVHCSMIHMRTRGTTSCPVSIESIARWLIFYRKVEIIAGLNDANR